MSPSVYTNEIFVPFVTKIMIFLKCLTQRCLLHCVFYLLTQIIAEDVRSFRIFSYLCTKFQLQVVQFKLQDVKHTLQVVQCRLQGVK